METAAALVLLTAAVWPLARLCTHPAFRRTQPVAARRLGALLLPLVTGGALLAWSSEPAACAVAGAAAAALLARWWRARPSYGRRHGLPPGSLTLGPPLGAFADDLFYLAQAHRHGPVFKVGGFRRGQVCVVGLAGGLALLREHEAELAAPPMPYSGLIPKAFVRYMSLPDHEVYRPVLRAALGRELVDAAAATMTAAVRRRLTRPAAACGADGAVAPDGELAALAFEVLLHLVYGAEPGTPDAERLTRLYTALDHRPGAGGGPDAMRAALAALGEELHSRGRADSGVAPSSAAGAAARLAGSWIDDETLRSNLAFIPRLAAADLGDGLLWLVYRLARHPEWPARLRTSGDAAGDDLAARLVTETLRLHQSEYLVRRALTDIRYAGFVIPRGWLVRVCVRESHRDPEVFPDPNAFDPDRHRDRSFPRHQLAPFGGDRHACLGEHLTRTFGSVLARELALAYDVELVADGPPEMGPLHWRPSRRFRVRIAPLARAAAEAVP